MLEYPRLSSGQFVQLAHTIGVLRSSHCVYLPFSLGRSSRKARGFNHQTKHTKTVITSTLNPKAMVQMGLYTRYTPLSMELARNTGTLLSRSLESSPIQTTNPDQMLAASPH